MDRTQATPSMRPKQVSVVIIASHPSSAKWFVLEKLCMHTGDARNDNEGLDGAIEWQIFSLGQQYSGRSPKAATHSRPSAR